VESAQTASDRGLQRALLQYWEPRNHALVKRALERAGRRDLIGDGRECLIPARAPAMRDPAMRDDDEPRGRGPSRNGEPGYRGPARSRARR
jgi:hypothetical protein